MFLFAIRVLRMFFIAIEWKASSDGGASLRCIRISESKNGRQDYFDFLGWPLVDVPAVDRVLRKDVF